MPKFEAELNPEEFYKTKEITVLMVPNGKPPKPRIVENSMRAIKQMMGGFVDSYLLEDHTIMICIRRKQLDQTEPNRTIYDEKGHSRQTVYGDFFLCNLSENGQDFESLSPEQIKKYTKSLEHSGEMRMPPYQKHTKKKKDYSR